MQYETTDRRTRAVKYLQQYTRAMRDVIERFVELFWDQEVTDEENLIAFENYESELETAYTTSARSTRHTGVTVPKRSSTNISTSTKYATAVPETFGNHSCKNMSL